MTKKQKTIKLKHRVANVFPWGDVLIPIIPESLKNKDKKEKKEKYQYPKTEEEFMKQVREENEHFRKTGIPRCSHCHRNMVNGIDSITKKISKYIWEFDCDCQPKNMRLMMV